MHYTNDDRYFGIGKKFAEELLCWKIHRKVKVEWKSYKNRGKGDYDVTRPVSSKNRIINHTFTSAAARAIAVSMLRAYLRSSRGNTPAQITFIYSLIDNYDSLHRSPFRATSKGKKKKKKCRFYTLFTGFPSVSNVAITFENYSIGYRNKSSEITRNFPTFIRLSMQRSIDARFLNLEVDAWNFFDMGIVKVEDGRLFDETNGWKCLVSDQ